MKVVLTRVLGLTCVAVILKIALWNPSWTQHNQSVSEPQFAKCMARIINMVQIFSRWGVDHSRAFDACRRLALTPVLRVASLVLSTPFCCHAHTALEHVVGCLLRVSAIGSLQGTDVASDVFGSVCDYAAECQSARARATTVQLTDVVSFILEYSTEETVKQFVSLDFPS